LFPALAWTPGLTAAQIVGAMDAGQSAKLAFTGPGSIRMIFGATIQSDAGKTLYNERIILLII
jgi:hypothetical protein